MLVAAVRVAVFVPLIVFLWRNRLHGSHELDGVRKLTNRFIGALAILFAAKLYISIQTISGVNIPSEIDQSVTFAADSIVAISLFYASKKIREL